MKGLVEGNTGYYSSLSSTKPLCFLSAAAKEAIIHSAIGMLLSALKPSLTMREQLCHLKSGVRKASLSHTVFVTPRGCLCSSEVSQLFQEIN